jgi:chromate transporter
MGDQAASVPSSGTRQRRAVWEIFRAFLKLGLTSFGGPIAHLGYLRHEFVEKRHWLDEHAYADLVALCLSLPKTRRAVGT